MLTLLQRDPQRLSALYQYHNAPEVAPAHGLEYDDTIHSASSDKYPVVHPRSYESTHVGKIYDNDRPPRIIFGMKVRTFLMVAAVMVVVIVGAAVGGAVGGSRRENHVQQGSSPANIEGNTSSDSESRYAWKPPIEQPDDTNNGFHSSSPTSASPSSFSSYRATVPTYVPLNPCPDANDTTYTSPLSNRQSDSASKTAGLKFTRYCDVDSPVDGVKSASTLSEAFVYSLDDCVEVCASLNYWAGNQNCTVAVYDVKGSRPGNCWVGGFEGVSIEDLQDKDGVAVAILST